MCFGPPDLAFVFDLPGYGQVGKMAVMLRNVYDVICEKQAAMVRTSHLTKSLIIGENLFGVQNFSSSSIALPPSKQSQSNERLLSRKKNRISHLLHEEWDSHKKTSTKGLSPAPPRKGTRVLDDEPEKEPPRKSVVCSLRNEIMNYVFWCLAGFKGYPLLAKLNVPPTAGSRD
ncbi:Ras family [Musa troglodytarum]|uniref:Ras family n=1 Tax=Musa troglodytarum TaxID=320322 RepID=A0A9E7G346_9LILI|nr:Ras family [Musa troglodytarum]